MFIKWAKEAFAKWYDEYGFALFVYVLASWIFVFFILAIGRTPNDHMGLVMTVFVPFLVMTGILPSILFVACKACIYIYNLYLDYSYFVANGGKHKRDEDSKN